MKRVNELGNISHTRGWVCDAIGAGVLGFMIGAIAVVIAYLVVVHG
jgi:hypothetical protein